MKLQDSNKIGVQSAPFWDAIVRLLSASYLVDEAVLSRYPLDLIDHGTLQFVVPFTIGDVE